MAKIKGNAYVKIGLVGIPDITIHIPYENFISNANDGISIFGDFNKLKIVPFEKVVLYIIRGCMTKDKPVTLLYDTLLKHLGVSKTSPNRITKDDLSKYVQQLQREGLWEIVDANKNGAVVLSTQAKRKRGLSYCHFTKNEVKYFLDSEISYSHKVAIFRLLLMMKLSCTHTRNKYYAIYKKNSSSIYYENYKNEIAKILCISPITLNKYLEELMYYDIISMTQNVNSMSLNRYDKARIYIKSSIKGFEYEQRFKAHMTLLDDAS